MSPDERARLSRQLETLDDRLVTSLVRLISGEVAALRLPGGWRIVLDPVRPNESQTGSKDR